ncbi:MAG: hypothetical protein RLZZ97_2256 [Gemmatimonadota bacterium]
MKVGESVRPTIRFIAPVHHYLARGATTRADVTGTILRWRDGRFVLLTNQSAARAQRKEDTKANCAPVPSVVQPQPR